MKLSDDELALILLALKAATIPHATAPLIQRIHAEMGLRVAQDFRER